MAICNNKLLLQIFTSPFKSIGKIRNKSPGYLQQNLTCSGWKICTKVNFCEDSLQNFSAVRGSHFLKCSPHCGFCDVLRIVCVQRYCRKSAAHPSCAGTLKVCSDEIHRYNTKFMWILDAKFHVTLICPPPYFADLRGVQKPVG